MSISLTRPRVAWAAVSAGLAATLLSGCGQENVLISRVPETAIPSGTADSRAAAAVSAYKMFLKTIYYAQRHPAPPAESSADSASNTAGDKANFARYSFDPVAAQYEAFMDSLVDTRHAFRGTPPKSAISVTSIDLGGTPYPMVTLADCQTEGSTWRAYSKTTNAENPALTPGIPAPNGSVVSMIYRRQHWGVMAIRPDPAGTCAG